MKFLFRPHFILSWKLEPQKKSAAMATLFRRWPSRHSVFQALNVLPGKADSRSCGTKGALLTYSMRLGQLGQQSRELPAQFAELAGLEGMPGAFEHGHGFGKGSVQFAVWVQARIAEPAAERRLTAIHRRADHFAIQVHRAQEQTKALLRFRMGADEQDGCSGLAWHR
ncbi:hypothetical protein [Pseudomonas sp. UBA6310]|uniref:hypothetical protein n=1 Tax=Pseudomonas sp. UBA6310 TaxID=1947327 RepID=UPI002579BC00|nr:hypothetical protein [Pseudomonas sp. UBA6310]